MVVVRVAHGCAGSTTTGRGVPVAAPPTTAPATPPTAAPTGPPTTAPVTAPPAAPVKAPLSSAEAIVERAKSETPARATTESLIGKLLFADILKMHTRGSKGDERVSKTAPSRLLSSSLGRDVHAKRGARLPSSANRLDGRLCRPQADRRSPRGYASNRRRRCRRLVRTRLAKRSPIALPWRPEWLLVSSRYSSLSSVVR